MGETEEETEEGNTTQVLFHLFPQPAVLYARALTGGQALSIAES